MNVLVHPATPDDDAFLRELFSSVQGAVFDLLPPGQFDQAAYLRMAYWGRDQQYRVQYPSAMQEVIWVDGVAVGALFMAREVETWRILDISLLTEHRNRGIGKFVLGMLLADAAGLPVCLQVDARSSARRLYERLGFKIVKVRQLTVEMCHFGNDESSFLP